MKVLSFVNNKGGVGKTTSVQNVAAYFSEVGKKVLLIDLDPQRGNLSRCYGMNPDELKYNSGDLILGNVGFDDVVLKSERLHIIPSTKSNKDHENTLAGKNMYHNKLKKVLSEVKKNYNYDYCLIDCPPALGAFTTNALYASDFYFVPLQAKFLSYEGLASILDFTREIEEESSAKLGGVFATKYNPNIRRSLDHEIVGSVDEQLQGFFFKDCFIRENVSLDEAQSQGKDIFEYSPQSNGAKDYKKLSEKILEVVSSNS